MVEDQSSFHHFPGGQKLQILRCQPRGLVESGQCLFELPVFLKFDALAKSVVSFFQILLRHQAIDSAGNPVPTGNRRGGRLIAGECRQRERGHQKTERDN